MKDQVAQDLLEVSKELAKTVELLNATVARNCPAAIFSR